MTLTAAPVAGIEVRLEPAAEAVVFRGPDRPLERIAVPELTLHPREALVEVELATVCGSDVHTVAGHRRVAVPQVLGHEQVGRVVALGPGDPARTLDGARLRVGDRIVWGVVIDCGSCRQCRRGHPQKCESLQKYGHEQMRRGWELSGGFATHVHLLPRTPIVRVPEELPAEVLAPASCATATITAAIAAAAQVRALDGELVVVAGCGMLGLTAIAMATELGARVVAVDPDPARRALAAHFGAKASAEPRTVRVHEALRRTAHRRQRDAIGHGVAIEASGHPDSIGMLIDTADTGATIVLVGSVFTAPPLPLHAEQLVRRLLTIRGVHNYRPEHLAQAVGFLERSDHRAFAALVGETVPLEQAAEALARPAARGARIGIRPR